jgi:hypothetical protein
MARSGEMQWKFGQGLKSRLCVTRRRNFSYGVARIGDINNRGQADIACALRSATPRSIRPERAPTIGHRPLRATLSGSRHSFLNGFDILRTNHTEHQRALSHCADPVCRPKYWPRALLSCNATRTRTVHTNLSHCPAVDWRAGVFAKTYRNFLWRLPNGPGILRVHGVDRMMVKEL